MLPSRGFAEPWGAAGAVFLVRLVSADAVPADEAVAHAPVAEGAGLLEAEPLRVAGLFIVVAYGAGQLFCPAGQTHAGDRDGRAVRDQLRCFPCTDEFRHKCASLNFAYKHVNIYIYACKRKPKFRLSII